MVGKDKEATKVIGVKNDTDEVIKVRERDRIGGALPNRWIRIKPGKSANVKIREDCAKKKGLTILNAPKLEVPETKPETKTVIGRVSGKVIETKKVEEKEEKPKEKKK